MTVHMGDDALQASLLEAGTKEPRRDQRYSSPRSRGLLVASLLLVAGCACLAFFPSKTVSDPVKHDSGLAEYTFVANSPSTRPPFFHITAESPYDAGLQHGRLARAQIQAWFSSAEMHALFDFVFSGEGREAFAKLKHDNSIAFPSFVEEMQGIVEGADVTMDEVWAVNMINEIENLMAIAGVVVSREATKGCSDEYFVSPEGYASGFGHGHNDDWSLVAKQFWYFLSVSPTAAAVDVTACAGVVYPATLVGWAPTWNAHGMYSTQNTLLPKTSRPGGLACAFVQRAAVCPARGLDEFITALTRPGWSDGASMNVVDLKGKRMANIEIWEDRHSVLEVTASMSNYSHFNNYKHLSTEGGSPVDDPSKSLRDLDLRQSRVDSLPPPRSTGDIIARLSDPAVFMETTLMTLILNGTTGLMNIWCCGVSAASAPETPVYSFNLLSFFH